MKPVGIYPWFLLQSPLYSSFPLIPDASFPLQDVVEPIYFYVGTVLGLQAVYVTALFVCSWVMSGTWVAGVLTVAWFVINR